MTNGQELDELEARKRGRNLPFILVREKMKLIRFLMVLSEATDGAPRSDDQREDSVAERMKTIGQLPRT